MIDQHEYDNLVISGGALKGFAILGCLSIKTSLVALHWQDTSIGAIIGFLLCIGLMD